MPDQDKRKEWNEAYKQALSAWSAYILEAQRDLKYYVGDQWSATDKAYLRQQRREILTFNKIKRCVQLVVGYQRKHRLAIKVDPVATAFNPISELETQTANQFSACCQWELSKPYGGYQVMSQAFSGAVKTGLNLVELYLDYSEDPESGDIRFSRLAYNQFLLDPNLSRIDLSDCSYVLKRRWLSLNQAKMLLGKHADGLDEIKPKGWDEKFTFYRASKGPDGKNLYRYDEFWQRDTKRVQLLIDKATGQTVVWPGSRRKLREFLQTPHPALGIPMGEMVEVIPHHIPTVNLTVLVEDQVFYSGPEPWGLDDYPFVAIWCFFDPEHDKYDEKLQGLVRNMRDPQREHNKRLSKLLDIVDTMGYGGLIVKEDALVDPTQAYRAGHGLPLFVKSTKSLDDVRERGMPNVPAGLFQLAEFMGQELIHAGLVTDELLGDPSSTDVQIAGILAKLRQAAGLTLLQEIFDNYRESKRTLGYKLIKLLQNHYTPAKIAEIINESPTPAFYSKTFPKFSCSVGEGLLTDTQRQMYHLQLLQYKQMGAEIPWSEIIDTAPIEGAKRLKEILKQQEQSAAQAAQAQSAAQQMLSQLAAAETMARTEAAHAKRAQAEKTLADADLSRAKAMVELEKLVADIRKIDADRLLKLLRYVSDEYRQTRREYEGLNPR